MTLFNFINLRLYNVTIYQIRFINGFECARKKKAKIPESQHLNVR